MGVIRLAEPAQYVRFARTERTDKTILHASLNAKLRRRFEGDASRSYFRRHGSGVLALLGNVGSVAEINTPGTQAPAVRACGRSELRPLSASTVHQYGAGRAAFMTAFATGRCASKKLSLSLQFRASLYSLQCGDGRTEFAGGSAVPAIDLGTRFPNTAAIESDLSIPRSPPCRRVGQAHFLMVPPLFPVISTMAGPRPDMRRRVSPAMTM